YIISAIVILNSSFFKFLNFIMIQKYKAIYSLKKELDCTVSFVTDGLFM
ncbi:MAG: hypothetical protein ACI8P3_004603, partial [Saprospiraceae bacterium]